MRQIQSGDQGQRAIVNVAQVAQRSPFRYPGGKTWLVPQIKEWIANLGFRPHRLVEPFAGGAIVSLTSVLDELVDEVVFSEIDPAVANVWKTILSSDGARWLSDRILKFRLSRESVVAELGRRHRKIREKAFQTILRNRVQRGGIMAPGAGLVKTGENGKGIGSRWYPETLSRRINEIAQHRHKFKFLKADAFDVIPLYLEDPCAVYFVDPPYTAAGKKAGKRLYAFNDIDHEALFGWLAKAKGAVMMTYDDTPEIADLAQRFGFSLARIPMKNSHHATMCELVITKGFNQLSLRLS